MAKHEITKSFSNNGSRNDVRKRVVSAFSEEISGTGRGALASQYIYYVETLSDSNRIYLQRPANLHNGFDFLVCVENYNFNEGGRYRNYPKQDDVLADLRFKKDESLREYRRLFQLIEQVYNCHDVSESEWIHIQFETGFVIDFIPKVLKWLFIEQDIRYWNYSGRNMLWDAICSV